MGTEEDNSVIAAINLAVNHAKIQPFIFKTIRKIPCPKGLMLIIDGLYDNRY